MTDLDADAAGIHHAACSVHEDGACTCELISVTESATRGWQMADSLHLTIRDLRVALDTAIKERDTARAKVRLITQQYKPGWVDGLEAVARAAGYDPDKVRHEGVDPPTFIEDVIEDMRAENSRLRKECERLLESERLALETARQAVIKKEETLSDYVWCAKHEWENVEPCWYCAKEGSVLENVLVDNSLPPPPVRVPVASFGIPIRTYEADHKVSKSSSNDCPDYGAGPDE